MKLNLHDTVQPCKMTAKDKSNLYAIFCLFGNILCDENHAIITVYNSFVCNIVARIFAKQKCRRFTSAGISFHERAHRALLFAEAFAKFSGVRFCFSRVASIAIGP